jgi:hypothetical protein
MWPLFGGAPRTIVVSDVEGTLRAGMEFIAARTNFSLRGSKWERLMDASTDAGIAVSGPAEIGRFVSVSVDSAEGRSVVSHLKNLFDSAELNAIVRRHDELSQPGVSPEAIRHPDAAQRHHVSFQGTLARAVRSDRGGTWYAVQVARTYGKPKSLEECTPVTEFDAKVVRGPGARLTVKSLSAFATDRCGHLDQTTWLGTLHWQGRLLWIGRVDDDGVDYGLVDPNAADPHFIRMKQRQ